MTGGRVLDLRRLDPDDGKPWDLSVASKQIKAEWMIEDMNPDVVIGSCMPKGPWAKQAIHLAYLCRLYAKRIERGKRLLHQQPWHHWSWKVDYLNDFIQRPSIHLWLGQ